MYVWQWVWILTPYGYQLVQRPVYVPVFTYNPYVLRYYYYYAF